MNIKEKNNRNTTVQITVDKILAGDYFRESIRKGFKQSSIQQPIRNER